MSIAAVRDYFAQFGMADNVLEFSTSSATVELAAQAAGVIPARIAKSLSFKVDGKANTFIFPEIQSGNIGYKIAQRLGGFAAYGPILQGLNAPINDLSRGCDADEVYKMAIITAALA